jgi:hypothetical protein
LTQIWTQGCDYKMPASWCNDGGNDKVAQKSAFGLSVLSPRLG